MPGAIFFYRSKQKTKKRKFDSLNDNRNSPRRLNSISAESLAPTTRKLSEGRKLGLASWFVRFKKKKKEKNAKKRKSRRRRKAGGTHTNWWFDDEEVKSARARARIGITKRSDKKKRVRKKKDIRTRESQGRARRARFRSLRERIKWYIKCVLAHQYPLPFFLLKRTIYPRRRDIPRNTVTSATAFSGFSHTSGTDERMLMMYTAPEIFFFFFFLSVSSPLFFRARNGIDTSWARNRWAGQDRVYTLLSRAGLDNFSVLRSASFFYCNQSSVRHIPQCRFLSVVILLILFWFFFITNYYSFFLCFFVAVLLFFFTCAISGRLMRVHWTDYIGFFFTHSALARRDWDRPQS